MALATYKDLCIDAVDTGRMSRFWGAALQLQPQPRDGGLVELAGPTPGHTVWLVPVPEPVTVKQRAHVDVRAASARDVEALGATVVDAESFAWQVMRDPEGGELCVFETADHPHGLYELVVDTDRDTVAIATWWAEVLGGQVDQEEDFAFVDSIPGFPYDCIVFAPVPEPKTVKNRVHFDVWAADPDALVQKGATVLRRPDAEIGWTVLADPDGNEFCAFVPES